MTLRSIIILICIATLHSCNISKQTSGNDSPFTAADFDTSTYFSRNIYNGSNTLLFDIIHTRLEVSFDWEKCQLHGNASITLRPYFYSSKQLVLNAQEFDIHEIALLKGDEKKTLTYTYDKKLIRITLDKEYKSSDTLQVFISYTANPNLVATTGSDAITDRKGLYFINPDGSDQNKPKQIWTQGETEANSCWFPTIETTNDRMTQEIYMTVDKKYVSLSNGLLIYSKENTDGTRTDYWKQSLPAAPYLTMLAIGDFSIVKDSWRDIEVNYYVEPNYKQYAKLIFGNTPEMLEFFSNKLGVDYPWEKFSQIVVRDYVSGAMENTSAVVHGEFIQVNDRKFVDNTNEDVIAHELFHHWFGDLVTCESWANIPLNESFATYGEYLWMEYKYGQDAADHHIQQDFYTYLREAREKKVSLIRYDYEEREGLFDAHSYQKGCRILHMLRKHVGDEAFFKALNLYLSKNKFKAVETANLRMAFEEVTGEDLNWFFNEWFFSAGHPALTITYEYDTANAEEIVSIQQTQDSKKYPIYKLPINIDIYANGKTERHKVTIDQPRQSFTFKVSSKPDLVNVDADKMLLATKQDDKEVKEWVFQYYNAPLYIDRYESVYIIGELGADSSSEKVLLSAFNDPFWYIRELAIKYCEPLIAKHKNEIKATLSHMAITDPEASVRAEAIIKLDELFPGDTSLMQVYQIGFKDKSYNVSRESINCIAMLDSLTALNMVKELEKENDLFNDVGIAKIYSLFPDSSNNNFFELAIKRSSDNLDKINLLNMYGIFLKGQTSDQVINKGISILENEAKNETTWWVKLYGYYAISSILSGLETKSDEINVVLSRLKKNKKSTPAEITTTTLELEKITMQKNKLEEILASIRNSETDEKVKAYYIHEQ